MGMSLSYFYTVYKRMYTVQKGIYTVYTVHIYSTGLYVH